MFVTEKKELGELTGNGVYDTIKGATSMATLQLVFMAAMHPGLYDNANNNFKSTPIYQWLNEGAIGANAASRYGIDMDNLNFSNTVQNHTGRPYQDYKLLINEIIESKHPIADPQGTSALYWEVEGSFNGNSGIYELLIDPESNTVWHLLFKKY